MNSYTKKVICVCVYLFSLCLLVTPRAIFAADNTPYFIVGDGSGGGGAGGNAGMNGGSGGGGDDTLDYSSSTATNVIFGDGSGGGGGGRGVGFTNNVVVGGLGGGGNDTITTGSGNDVIFGDGFNGINTGDGVFYPGSGGLGGGGGGAAGGGFGGPPPGFAAGLCGGGGGGGTHNGGTFALLVACGNSTQGSVAAGSSYGGNGGNAATPESGSQGLGGAYSGAHGGGGGGFGGATGGTGVTVPQNGNTTQYRVQDTGSVVYNYFTQAILRSVLTNFPNYGAGADVINGRGGTNELFGLGGNDQFIIDSADQAVRNRIWDFSPGDSLILKTNGSTVAVVDIDSYVSGAVVGDYDGDGASDDTRITFSGTNIDLANITSIVTNGSGNIGATNHAPTISLADSNLSYTVNAAATQVDSAGTVTDSDGNTDWNGGTLSAQITANSTANDTLSLSGTSIEITGTTLKYLGASIGIVSATNGTVTGNTTLLITFNSGATDAIAQIILRNIRFSTSSAGTSDRVVKIIATDKNGASVDDARTIDVSGAAAIVYYTVSASAGTGGTISPSSRSIASGSAATFTVTPDGGYAINTVSGCSGSLVGTTYTTGAVSADCSVSASFTANSYSVIFDTQGGDSITTVTQAYATSVTLPSATKAANIFSTWNTQANGTGTTYNASQSISMPVNGVTLFAQWTAAYTLTYTAGAGGTLSGSTSQTVAPSSNGTAVTAVPNAHYHFVDWSDASTANPRTDTNVSQNVTVTANFAIDTYSVTYTAGVNGSISGTSSQTINYGGDSSQVTATADAGYHFTNWSDGSTANPRIDYNITANKSVSANFAADDPNAPVISAVSATPNEVTATITWTTDEGASSQVQYGLYPSYGFSTMESDTISRVTAHSVTLSNLASCARYFYRVLSKDATNNQSASAQKTFTTQGCVVSSIVNGSESYVPVSGGTLELVNNLSTAGLVVPDGYAGEEATFQLNKLNSASAPSGPGGKVVATNNLYELLAVKTNEERLTSFSTAVTFTVSYGTDTETNYYENTLDVYKYNGTEWEKKNCSLDTSANTLTCSLTGFSAYGVLGNPRTTSTGTVSQSSSSSGSSATVPGCDRAKPVGSPDLFQINSDKEYAKIFFTPLSDTDEYFISFSEEENAERHGASPSLSREGVQNYTIYLLKPYTGYFIKVRGQNGCMPGDWSNIMYFISDGRTYYKYHTATNVYPNRMGSTLTNVPTTEQTASEGSLTPQPTPARPKKVSAPTKENIETSGKSFCIFGWCW